jgi:hypothetical protein
MNTCTETLVDTDTDIATPACTTASAPCPDAGGASRSGSRSSRRAGARRAARTLAGDDDRDTHAAALRSKIDQAAALAAACQLAALKATLAYTDANLHRDRDGFSSVRDWILETFPDLHESVASNIATIARLGRTYRLLRATASTGAAPIERIARAMNRLDSTGLRLTARQPWPEGPQASPYDDTVECTTPEATVAAHCTHLGGQLLGHALEAIAARLDTQAALAAELSQQALAWVDLQRRGDGMWDLTGQLADHTGQLLASFFQTATPPPRQDEADADGVLPAAVNRHAEALHQMITSHAETPAAPKRHGRTATLILNADLDTLQGAATGRMPTLEGRPIPVAIARLLACEAAVIPTVFNYRTGEVVELGRKDRLPNAALRRKLEGEQDGCIWPGCSRPLSWLEAHHVDHWIDGGATDADNLILVCRFHHGRLHTTHPDGTPRWSIVKTGPGTAEIRRSHCTAATPCEDCPTCNAAGLKAAAADLINPADLAAALDLEGGTAGLDLAAGFDLDLDRDEWASGPLGSQLHAYTRWAAGEADPTGHTTTGTTGTATATGPRADASAATRTATATKRTATATGAGAGDATRATTATRPTATADPAATAATRPRATNTDTDTHGNESRHRTVDTTPPPDVYGKLWSANDPIPF